MPPSPLSRFGRAFSLPFRSLGLIRRHAELRRLSGAAALTCFVLLVAVTFGALKGGPLLADVIWHRPAGGWLVLWQALRFVVSGLLFVLGASVVSPLGTSPFLDPISANTEKAALGLAPPSGGNRIAEVARSLRKNLLRVTIFLIGNVLLLALGFIPAVGVLSLPLSILWSSLALAFEYVDIPGNRHGFGFRDTLRLLKNDLATTLGLGLALYLLLWIPLLNCLMVPTGVVAATTLFHQHRE